MSTYVVRPEHGHGLFVRYAVRHVELRQVITRTPSLREAQRMSSMLNASSHTSHRRRHRMPLWYHFAIALIRTSALAFSIAYVLSYR